MGKLLGSLALWVAIFGLVPTGSGRASASTGPSSTNLIVGLNVADIQTVDAEVAVQEGFFQKQHLKVTFVNLPASDALDALVAGTIQIGEADPVSLLHSYDSGNNVKMLAGGSRANFLLDASNALKCPTWKSAFPGPLACLVGHTIGVPVLGGLVHQIAEYLMSEAPGCIGGGAHCVTWVANTNVLSALPGLSAGTVQAQASWASAGPIYKAHRVSVWTVANAQLPPSTAANSGKLVPLNVTAVPVATAGELNAAPRTYEGFCQAMLNANAWLRSAKNLKRASVITQTWLGDGTGLATATAELKLQLAANVAHVAPTQWRASERIATNIQTQPYQNVDWAPCNRLKAQNSV